MGTSIVVDASVFDPVVFDPVVFNPVVFNPVVFNPLGVDAGVPLDLSVFAPDSKPYDPFAGVGVCAETLHAAKPDLETLEKKLLSIQSMLIQSPIPLPEKEAEQQELFRQIRAIRSAPKREGSTKFSTAYARAWLRKTKFSIIAAESYDFRTKRTFDAPMAMDFIAAKDALYGFQSMTPGQEQAHLRKFIERGGHRKAHEKKIRACFYLVFKRVHKDPVRIWLISGTDSPILAPCDHSLFLTHDLANSLPSKTHSAPLETAKGALLSNG